MRKFYLSVFVVYIISLGFGAFLPIHAQESEDEFDLEISGVLQEVNQDSIVVSGVTILITEDTELPDDLAVDAKVDVYVNYVDEEFTAVIVELVDDEDEDDEGSDGPTATEEPDDSPDVTEEPDDDSDDEDDEGDDLDDDEDEDEVLEFTGTLEQIDLEFIVLSGVTIQLNDITEIEDELVVGETYEIKIELDEDSFIADEIELDDNDENEDEDEDDREGPISTDEPGDDDEDDDPVGTEEPEDDDGDHSDDDDDDNSGHGSGDDDREDDDDDDRDDEPDDDDDD